MIIHEWILAVVFNVDSNGFMKFKLLGSSLNVNATVVEHGHFQIIVFHKY